MSLGPTLADHPDVDLVAEELAGLADTYGPHTLLHGVARWYRREVDREEYPDRRDIGILSRLYAIAGLMDNPSP